MVVKSPTAAELFLQNRLKFLRAAAGFTQAEVAERSKISPIYYQSIEAGRRYNVSLEVIENIAVAYRLSIHELFAPVPPAIKNLGQAIPRPHYQRKNPAKRR